MDSAEKPLRAPPEEPLRGKRGHLPGNPAERGSQSKFPSILFWIAGAALALRVFTALTDRGKPEAAAGLVSWRPLETASAAGRAAGKPLLYDFTAAWCAPCRRLDSEGWGDSRIARMVNEGFLPARVVDRQTEDGRNLPAISELQQRYRVNAFPTLIVADASGREIARSEGYAGKDQLVKFLQEARKKAGR
jgi:thiol:disulfide interchange protein